MVHEKKTRGRQKIDIVKIENEQNRQVTFCKRRAGLFKKASELCTLTGSEVALVVFSQGEKAYCFGNPSVNAIIDRFESQTPKSVDSSNLILESHRKINVQHFNNELTILQNHFEAEKKKGKTLNQQRKVGETRHWWEAPIEKLNLEQLEQFNLALLELQKNIKSELRKIVFEHSNQKGNVGGLNPYGIDHFGIKAREIGPSVFYRSHFVVPGNMAFTPYVGPSRLNTCISSKDGNIVSKIESGPSSSVTFNPNASEFGTTTIHPLPPKEFNNGYDSVKQF